MHRKLNKIKTWKDDKYSDLSEFFYYDTKRVSLLATNGKSDDLEPDDIRHIMFEKLKG